MKPALGMAAVVAVLMMAELARAATVQGCTCLSSSACSTSGYSYNWCRTADSCGDYSYGVGYWDKCNAQCESGCPSGSSCGDATALDSSYTPVSQYDPPKLACVCAAASDCVPTNYCSAAANRIILYEGATCHVTGSKSCCVGTVCSSGSWGSIGYVNNVKSCCTDGSMSATTGSCSCGTVQTCGASGSSTAYYWNYGTPGSCSKTCGGGTQTRSVYCENSSGTKVADSYCPASDRPASTLQCNVQSCSDAVPGSTAAAVASSTGSAAIDYASIWAGSFAVDSACSQTDCCCLTGTVSVARLSATSVQMTSSVGPLSNCGTSTVSLEIDNLEGRTFSTKIGYSLYTVVRTDTGITVNNINDPQCSGAAVQVKQGNSASNRAALATSTVVAIGAFAALT